MKKPVRILSLGDLPNTCSSLVYEISGVDVHLNFQPAQSVFADTLLIGFHGYVDREKRSIPTFTPFLPDAGGDVHQLAISDPSLRIDPMVRMSWFSGDCEFDAQKLLPELFIAISNALGVRRTIYYGFSGGGFAALYYSRQHCGSLALVGNPQTSIADYYRRHVANYLSKCWPGVDSIAGLAGQVKTNLATVYSSGEIDNHIIYLQNSSDPFHLFGHMAPFLASIRSGASRKRIACACSYPGKLGHTPVWELMSSWLRAAVVAPDWMAETIITNHHSLIERKQLTISPVTSANEIPVSAKVRSALDLQMANFVRDYHLYQFKKG